MPPSPQPPKRIGRYRLGPVLGKGGTGQVYEATLEGPGGFEKRVALKVFLAGAQAPGSRDRMFREARLGALLRHPNLVDTYELGESDGYLFIAMELVDGPTVGQLLERDVLPLRAALEVARQMCAGLAHAHELVVKGRPAAIVHRDIKPSNVIVGRTGLVKIADLGIAHIAGSSERVEGTRGYMSPEQCAGKPLDPRSDIFSLGVLMWAMATGHTPLKKASTPKTFLATLNVDELFDDPEAIAPLDALDPSFTAILRRCMRRDPDVRYPDVGALGRDLRALLKRTRGTTLLDLLYEDEDAYDVDSAMWVRLPGPDTVSVVTDASALRPVQPPPTPLVGRRKEMRELASLRRGGTGRWTTVIGPAGVGKSRMVQEMLAGSERTAYANLFGILEPTEALTALRSALSLPLLKDHTVGMVDAFLASLARMGPVTVVLDNADGVLGLVRGLHREAPPGMAARFLVTARDAVGLADEAVIELGPLPTEDAVELFRTVAQRAFTDEEEAMLPDVVRRTSGTPAALELAAGQARNLSLDELVRSLRDRAALPAASSSGSTVEETVRWSWNLLREEEQATLSQLAVFEDPFTLEAADAVVLARDTSGAPWSLDLLAALNHHALVQTLPGADEARFQLTEAVRSYALTQLRAEDDVRERHAQWMARFGEPSVRARLHTADGSAHLDTLAAQRSDLVAACRWAAGEGEADLAGPIFLAAADLLLVRGPARIGVELSELVLPMRGLRRQRAEVLVAMARLLSEGGHPADAIARLTEAIRIAVRTEDEEAEGAARTYRALLMQQRGEPRAALEDARIAVERLEGRDQRLHAVALAHLGTVHRLQQNLQAARSVLETAVQRLEQANDLPSVASALATLGNVHRDAGRLAEAETALRQAIGLHQRCGDVRSECVTLGHLGAVLVRKGDLDDARAALEASLDLAMRLGHPSAEAVASSRLGRVLVRLDALDEARDKLEGALHALRRLGEERAEAETLEALAELYAKRQVPDRARDCLQKALEIYDGMGLLAQQIQVALRLAGLADADDAVTASLHWVQELRSRLESRGDTRMTAPLLLEEARLLHAQGDVRGAHMALIAADELLASAPRVRRLQARMEAIRRMVERDRQG